MQKQHSERTFPEPLFMVTLRQLILDQYRESTYLKEDFLVKTSAMLESELASRGVVLHSGNILPELLASCDQSSSVLKTFQPSIEGDLIPFCATLPRSGMMRNGIVYRLPPLVRFTAATGYLSWPTPTVADGFTDNLESTQIKQGSRHSLTLGKAVKMWPTPIAGDWKGQKRSDGSAQMLSGKIENSTAGGRLNPEWVEWLMGFPLGWTELSALETPLSRKTRKLSQKQSK